MLAAIFIKGGVDTLRNPEPRVQKATPLLEKVGAEPARPGTVRARPAGAHRRRREDRRRRAAGPGQVPAPLVAGPRQHPRPDDLAGHAFWEKSDPAEKAADQQQFLKNLSILGGLVLAAVDTEGKPSLGWRGRRAARKVAEQTRRPDRPERGRPDRRPQDRHRRGRRRHRQARGVSRSARRPSTATPSIGVLRGDAEANP